MLYVEHITDFILILAVINSHISTGMCFSSIDEYEIGYADQNAIYSV